MAVSRCGVVRREHEMCDCNGKVLQREIVTLPGTCKALSGRPGGPLSWETSEPRSFRVPPSKLGSGSFVQLKLDKFSELGDQFGPPRSSSRGPSLLRRGILLVRP